MELFKRGRMTIACCVLSASACHYMRTPFAIEQLNGTNTGADAPPRAPLRERIARLAAEHWSDSYYDSSTVAGWLSAAAKDPGPLFDLTSCIENSINPPAP